MSRRKIEVFTSIRAVSWSEGAPLKYQATGSVMGSSGTVIKNIHGEPCNTSHEAWASLKSECDAFEDCAQRIREDIRNRNLL